MIGQEHEQGRVEGVSPTEFMGVKIRVKISPYPVARRGFEL